jgi:LmbE family N-acetylglucosaminyl deacetylase
MNVLVVAAHPDDEVLGCGGTMARHAASGDDVSALILAEGIMAREAKGDGAWIVEAKERLREDARKAAFILGLREVAFLDFPDNRMDTMPLLDIIKSIEEAIRKSLPEIIYTHHPGDLNVDHGIVARSVLTATRPVHDCAVTEVYAFEVLSSTEWAFGPGFEPFRPNYFVDIEKHLGAKIDALRAYGTEVQPYPHPRSVEAVTSLARRRGSQSGLIAAEAFYLLRRVQR